MKVNLRIMAWLSACFCLILLTFGAFLWLSPPRSIPVEPSTIATNNTLSTSPTSITQKPVVNPQVAVNNPHKPVVNPQAGTLSSLILPPVDYPTGSIGEACELNTFPPRHLDSEIRRGLENSPYDSTGGFKQLNEEKCRLAVESHMNPINPNLLGKGTRHPRVS
ncbi:MAG: hypothetical protein OXG88_00105 [Gammaproteobacteria bacterium]|nr:hypothetical protein [Gammaproteobacteria bacterium]